MTRESYPPSRARQLRILLWVVVVAAVVLALVAGVLLLGGAPAGRVLVVLVAPATTLLGLGAWSLGLLGRQDPRSRLAASATGGVAVLVGLLLSRVAGGLLVGVLGVLVLLFALLPGRDTDPGAGAPREH